jgi:hypothetical protein
MNTLMVRKYCSLRCLCFVGCFGHLYCRFYCTRVVCGGWFVGCFIRSVDLLVIRVVCTMVCGMVCRMVCGGMSSPCILWLCGGCLGCVETTPSPCPTPPLSVFTSSPHPSLPLFCPLPPPTFYLFTLHHSPTATKPATRHPASHRTKARRRRLRGDTLPAPVGYRLALSCR